MSKEIKDTTRAFADGLKKKITLDPKTGVASLEDGYVAANLPEGVSAEAITKYQQFQHDLVVGAGLALGELSVPVLKKNGDLKETTLVIPTIGKDSIEFQFDRDFTSRNPKSGETTDGHGRISAKVVSYAARKTGEFGTVKAHLAELAQKSLAGK